VFAGAVILPDDFYHPLLNDSKQLTEKQRELLRPIIEKEAIEWAVVAVSAEEIDQINILNASIIGMHRCVDQLTTRPELILVDGNRFKPYVGIVHQCIVKGDSKFTSIAAASILAKTHRDEYMEKIDREFPMYKWSVNKGYPTKDHRAAIAEHGTTPHHRMTFKLL
jgi:ribonuclease HII